MDNNLNITSQFSNILDVSAKDYDIPKWYICSYTHVIYKLDTHIPIYAVQFPGKYKNCQFTDVHKMLQAIKMLIYRDRENNVNGIKEMEGWMIFVEENSTGWKS